MIERIVPDEAAMRKFAAEVARGWAAGDVVLLSGELGAGKTTFVRGVLECLGWSLPVRSPTFALVQVFPTQPPVLHADLYRVSGPSGLGLEEYFDDHLCFIEWPDRLAGMLDPAACWQVEIGLAEGGRVVTVRPPGRVSSR
ncbi:MAG TPA: tRNA (adenosine(37)-N6)-threonylcarbamoyltransferase complex ATPase subunit type 1 TsaE [Fimbriimonadaceae bacterium]|nr:tRNA (adenosine(37)-N6)-threonylcarbamoyltransferase complex ATPase subunit type 1 TsaE [Fimbriimonadaceae bacterium]HRJ96781.1 tRNA (adenosine(37)-N6)-threonylcarbamoyltransferase complex ATPase subunit type 1 TsaE [Fimbriimonadaceae bacterium]